MFEIFDEIGFDECGVIAICKYNEDIVAVRCDNAMSGIYPDYKTAQPLIMGWLYEFKLFNSIESSYDIDAIIFMKEKNKKREECVKIYFAEDSHDGFQIISKTD